MPGDSMPLADLRVLELGDALAASVAGRLFAELGAEVLQVRLPDPCPPQSTEARHARVVTDALKRRLDFARIPELAPHADLVLVGGAMQDLERAGWTPGAIKALAPTAVVVFVTPFGTTGPYRYYRATDLTTFHASGMARLLLGAVQDPRAEPPVRAAGEQSEFIAGVAAAAAAMAALYRRCESGEGTLIDVSVHEALASMAARELASPTLGIVPSSRTRRGDVLGASVVLRASDGWVSISPREAHQWRAWVEVMGSPAWASEPRFATNADRLQHAGELIALMSEWTEARTRREIYAACQAAHVPCFPVNGPADVLKDDHLRARGAFFRLPTEDGLLAPVPPFGLRSDARRSPPLAGASLPVPEVRRPRDAGGPPLAGVRVLDFSWVIAGPTATQFLAALGAEVVKVESTSRPDPGRRTALHDVLGRSKLNLGIDLKAPGAAEVILALARQSDVVLENFALGVVERLGIGEERLREVNRDIVYLSSSGLGRTGPQAGAVAYGTLVQCFVAFAELNGFPGHAPTPGFAWSDPLCGMLLAFAASAALYELAGGGASMTRVDHSMAEALLWTMPGTLVEVQRGLEPPRQLGNQSRDFVPHDAYPAVGNDQWIAIAVTTQDEWHGLCQTVPSLRSFAHLDLAARRERRGEIDRLVAAWTSSQDARTAMRSLQAAGVPAGATLDTQMMFEDEHLWAREFYVPVVRSSGEVHMLPRTPWRWPEGTRLPNAATGIGADNEEILTQIAGYTPQRVADLTRAGVLASDEAPNA